MDDSPDPENEQISHWFDKSKYFRTLAVLVNWHKWCLIWPGFVRSWILEKYFLCCDHYLTLTQPFSVSAARINMGLMDHICPSVKAIWMEEVWDKCLNLFVYFNLAKTKSAKLPWNHNFVQSWRLSWGRSLGRSWGWSIQCTIVHVIIECLELLSYLKF